MSRILYVCLFASALGGAALAAGNGHDDSPELNAAAAPPATNAAPAAADANKMICRDYPPPLGTRLGKRHVCMTKAQWKDLKSRSRDTVQDIQHRELLGNPQGG